MSESRVHYVVSRTEIDTGRGLLGYDTV